MLSDITKYIGYTYLSGFLHGTYIKCQMLCLLTILQTQMFNTIVHAVSSFVYTSTILHGTYIQVYYRYLLLAGVV